MMDTIGFLGCGNMGGAIARAVCKAVDPKKVFLANRTAAKAQALAKELGCKTATNAEVAGGCDLIFLAVKPQMMEALLQPLKFTLDERPGRFVLCSMAAGLSIARIQEMAGEDFPVIRIMPTLIGLMAAVGILRASGFLDFIAALIGSFTSRIGFPGELVPLSVVKMFSSSAATGLLLDIFKEYGTDSRLGLIASISLCCTETIFYTMSVYFMTARIKHSRYTLAGALIATFAGLAASVFLADLLL